MLSFLEYGAGFEKVWVELDTVLHFESAAKVAIASTDKSVEVPDLYFGQTYYLRYRVGYTDGYEEKKWNVREIGFETISKHNQRIEASPAKWMLKLVDRSEECTLTQREKQDKKEQLRS